MVTSLIDRVAAMGREFIVAYQYLGDSDFQGICDLYIGTLEFSANVTVCLKMI